MQAAKRKPKRFNFTKDAISRLSPPSEGRTYVYDAKQPGLALCVTAADSRTFYVYRKIDGKPERILLGPWPVLTVEQAREKAKQHIGKIAEGHNPNDKRRAMRHAPTFQAIFDLFIALPTKTKAKRPKTAKTVKGYRQQFDAYLTEWKDRQISTVTRPDVERLHNELAQANGLYTANRVLGLLKSLYNAALDMELYNANPAARVRAFEEQSRERFLQADELPKFWTALEKEPSEKLRDFIKLALFTGQRRSNVLAMRWEEINFERGIWYIPQTKTGKHEVPLTSEALEVLKRRHADPERHGEYVFPAHHGGGHLKDPMRAWRDILKRAGIANLRIHDLRRTMGSWQTITGASRPIVGKLLGHSREETTAIYGRLDMEPVRQSAEVATAAILAAAKPGKGAKNG